MYYSVQMAKSESVAGTQTASWYPVNLSCTDRAAFLHRFSLMRVLHLFKLLLLSGLSGLLLSAASGQTFQVNQPTLPLPSNALFHGIIGNQPADNSVQSYNPPMFKWIYTEDIPSTLSSALRAFHFQLSTNPSFSPLYWDIICSNNFYNALPPITNADGSTYLGTNYWRIIYMTADQTTTVGTGAVHNFTLAANATNWDRSMLADTNYLLGITSVHPHMWFNPGNVNAMASFLRSKPWPTSGQNWSSITNVAASFQNRSWWNNSSVTNLSKTSILAAAQAAQYVAFCYYMSGSNSVWDINGAAGTLNWFATGFLQYGLDQVDPYLVDPGAENTFATAYDWLYPFMTSNQRSNVLFTIESIAQFAAYGDAWAYVSQPAVTNRIYTNALQTLFYSCMKIGVSHERYCSAVGLECCISGMADSPKLLSLFPLFMNYSMAQFDPYQGDEGRGYSEQDNFKYDRLFGASALSTVQFPAAKLWMNPIYTNLAAFFANWEPVGYRAVLEPWGDLGYGFRSQWYNTRYYDLALITQNGAVLRQFNRALPFRLNSPDSFPLLGEAFLPFYYPTPLETDWPDGAYLDVVRGWAMSAAYPPSNWAAYTNGVGFVFQARPGGSRIEHSSFTDGQVELWAYGADCTAAGAAGGYAKHPMYYNGLMVNGIGLMNPASPPSDAYYSRIIAFTNAPNFTYAAGDITKGYNRSNYNTGGLGNMTMPFYTYPTNQVPYVSSVQRHVLFPHKKYLVIYDQMQTTQAATFQWLWHIWEPTALVNTNGCSFTYTCTNVYNGSNVAVYVQHVVDPSLMALKHEVGTNLSKFNPFTGENYFGKDNDLGPFYNSTVWAYNRTPTTNWHFLTVVFPVKWGQPAPTITRVDDYTVHVQQGADDDVIIVDASTSPPTFSLNLSGPTLGPSHLSPPSNLRVAP
jgi:hypothetical protein